MYHLGDPDVSPFFVGAGAGILLTTIGEGKADYKGYVIRQGSMSHVRPFFCGTFGMEVNVSKDIGGYLCARHTFAIRNNDLTNTNALSVFVGATFLW